VDFFVWAAVAMQASTMKGKKKDPEKKGIMKFAWNELEMFDHGIDPTIWDSWNEKFNAAGLPNVSDFYPVPVEHGGPTSLEVASHLRTHQQWTAEAYDKKREGTRHQNRYHVTYPAGQCVWSPNMQRSSAMRWENGSHKIVKDEAARLESPARPRNEALINRDDPEYADLVAEESDCDLADEFGDLCVVDHQDVPVDDGEDDVPIDEPLAIVDHAFMQRSNPAALMMDSHLPIRDRRQTVLLCVAEYEGRMRMKAEQAVAALTAAHTQAQQYERTLETEVFDIRNAYDEEYEMRVEAEKEKDELKEEITRLNTLFQDVSLLARDALGGN
jgi:hypothetical protein